MSAAAKPRHRPARKKGSPVPAAFGFLVLLVALLYGIVTAVQFQAEKARIETRYREERLHLEQRVESEKMEIEALHREWAAKLKTIQQENLQAKQKVQATQRNIEASQKELSELEKEKSKAGQQVAAQIEDKDLVGEGIDELRARTAALTRRRDTLISEFKEAYVALKQELRGLVDQGNPERVRQFFFTNRITPFAPAAAFFAADLFYGKNRLPDAARLYQDIVRQFPDSSYSAQAEKRLRDIEARLPYDQYDTPTYQPYKIPDSLDFGQW